jgi:hypothetical protein
VSSAAFDLDLRRIATLPDRISQAAIEPDKSGNNIDAQPK